MNEDVAQMGTLLSRMTAETANDIKFTDDQAAKIVEIVVPRMIMGMPGMPAGMKCSVTRDDTGWDIRVDRP